ncbi:MAG: hypothetical protein RJB66_2459 [Pseudomonadota bacterium]|jgi:2-succinyl-6-hydroxy-2,4-cyclohexadiene-1-carboxylate synthase
MENTLVIALHGFLGLPEDWTPWRIQNAANKHFLAPNLWTDSELHCSLSLADWTKVFLDFCRAKKAEGYHLELWGYSMGGRLALGALVEDSALFEKAVIISANPGLETENERDSRLQRDLTWAEKFRHQNWESLMTEWHSQPVLLEPNTVDKPVVRKENKFDRDGLAEGLAHWSLGRQPNYWPQLPTISSSLEWHVGALDKTYVSIAERVKERCSKVQLVVHPERGHRLIL